MRHDESSEAGRGSTTSNNTSIDTTQPGHPDYHELKRGSVIDALPSTPRQTMNIPTIPPPGSTPPAPTPTTAPVVSATDSPTE